MKKLLICSAAIAASLSAQSADYYAYTNPSNLTWDSTEAFTLDPTSSSVAKTAWTGTSADNIIYDNRYFYSSSALFLYQIPTATTLNNMSFQMYSSGIPATNQTMAFLDGNVALNVLGNIYANTEAGANKTGTYAHIRGVNLSVGGDVIVGSATTSGYFGLGGINFDTAAISNMRALNIGGKIQLNSSSRLYLGFYNGVNATVAGGIQMSDSSSIYIRGGLTGVSDGANYVSNATISVNGISGGSTITNAMNYKNDKGYFHNLTFNMTNTGTNVSNAMITSETRSGISVYKINISMTGSGSQTFSNSSNDLGGISVSNGKLFVGGSAENIEISGGSFGVTAENTIGIISAESLDWSGGSIAVDVNLYSCDFIGLNGDFTVSNLAQLSFDFSAVGEVSTDTDYRILEFDSTNISQSDLDSILYTFNGYEATFTLGSGYIDVSFAAIPEASHAAAALGAIALIFAAIRKRK